MTIAGGQSFGPRRAGDPPDNLGSAGARSSGGAMLPAAGPALPGLFNAPAVAARRLAAPGARVLEIGTAWGFSAVLMGLVARSLVSIDPHDVWDTWPAFTANIKRYGLERVVTAYRMRSEDVLPALIAAGETFDFAFVDGDHAEASAEYDIGACLQLVRAGGLIGVHDYSQRWGGVVAAVKRQLAGLPAWRIQDLYLAVLPA